MMVMDFKTFVMVMTLMMGAMAVLIAIIMMIARPSSQPPIIIATPPPQSGESGCGAFLILMAMGVIALAVFATLMAAG